MLVSHIDNYYVDWARMFLISLQRNVPKQGVFLFCADLSPEQEMMLVKCHSDLLVLNESVVVPKGLSRQRFMQCRVSKVLIQAWGLGFCQKYIVTNADMLVRKPLIPLYNLLDQCDVLLHFTEEHMKKKVPHQIQNGVIAFRQTQGVLEFLREYDRVLWEKGKVEAFADQRVLYQVYQLFKKRLVFGKIPDDYVDGQFKKDSHIWSGHSHGRFQNFQHFQRHLGEKVIRERPKDFV